MANIKKVDTAEYLNSSSGQIVRWGVASEQLTMIEPFEGSYCYSAPSMDLQPSSTESLQEPRLVTSQLLDRAATTFSSTAKLLIQSSLHSLWPASAMHVTLLF